MLQIYTDCTELSFGVQGYNLCAYCFSAGWSTCCYVTFSDKHSDSVALLQSLHTKVSLLF